MKKLTKKEIAKREKKLAEEVKEEDRLLHLHEDGDCDWNCEHCEDERYVDYEDDWPEEEEPPHLGVPNDER